MSDQNKKIAIEMIQMIPEGVKISLSHSGTYSREELVGHIKKGDEIGNKIIEIIFEYIEFLKNEKSAFDY